MRTPFIQRWRWCATALVLTFSVQAQAGLFEDEEARKAILEIRNEIQLLQRNLLEQQNQIEAVRAEVAKLRGEKEELLQDIKRQQNATQTTVQAMDERLRKFEPTTVKVDGVQFMAEPLETKAYEEALAVFRSGDFKSAANAFLDFIKRNPKSGYVVPSYFWAGNAQYANRDLKDAIKNFGNLIAKAPDHLRAAESLLSIANCQIDLKDLKAARKTLEDVISKYPNTEAAVAAKERIAKLK
jgi:tol-pal system protein YbgF